MQSGPGDAGETLAARDELAHDVGQDAVVAERHEFLRRVDARGRCRTAAVVLVESAVAIGIAKNCSLFSAQICSSIER